MGASHTCRRGCLCPDIEPYPPRKSGLNDIYQCLSEQCSYGKKILLHQAHLLWKNSSSEIFASVARDWDLHSFPNADGQPHLSASPTPPHGLLSALQSFQLLTLLSEDDNAITGFSSISNSPTSPSMPFTAQLERV